MNSLDTPQLKSPEIMPGLQPLSSAAVAAGATTPDRATVATQRTASECLYILAILLPYECYSPNVIEFVWHCRVAQSTVIITNERRGFTVAE